LVVILLIVAIPITLLWWFSASTSGESVARVLGEHGVCGCCGSLLAGREPEADGCTVCANCRAAWRVAPARPPTAQEVERSASEGDA
jgi:hypothetical protein